MTLHMYADRKGWPLEKVEVELSTKKIYARDCKDCESDADAKIDIIERSRKIIGDIDQEQRESLSAIADRCPDHRTRTRYPKHRPTEIVSTVGLPLRRSHRVR